jgi:hypothetical protein
MRALELCLAFCATGCGQVVLLGEVCDRGPGPSGPYGVEPTQTVNAALSWSGAYGEGATEPGTVTLYDYYSPTGCDLTHALVVMEVVAPGAGPETLELGAAFTGPWAGLGVRALQLLTEVPSGNPDDTAAQFWKKQQALSYLWSTAPDPVPHKMTSANAAQSLWLIDPRSMAVVMRLPRDAGGKANWQTIRAEAAALAMRNR